ncbi:AfsR/SARP family transcriptional regulator [Streptomyces sp. NPDC054863]
MEFRLLGGVGVASVTGELPLGPVKRRSVLTVLLLRSNAVVPMEQLIDMVWEEAPPTHARTVVQGHISRLRALFAGADRLGVRLVTRGPAYTLEMPDEFLDAHRFKELVRRGQDEERPEDVVDVLRSALALWRGPALTGTVPSAALRAAAQALEESRLVTVERLAQAYCGLGDHLRAATLLRAEAVAYPLREPLAAALMTALYRAGHQSDALDWFLRTRGRLSDELGVGPGPALRAAYEGILRGDPPRAVPPSGPAGTTEAWRAADPEHPEAADCPDPAEGVGPGGRPYREIRADSAGDRGRAEAEEKSAGTPGSLVPRRVETVRWVAGGPAVFQRAVPRLLPRATRGFHGRDQELTALDTITEDGSIALVTGAAGVGKTALALHWAHQRQGVFPDGVLFADLRGFGGGPVHPDDVVREFLIALGIPPRGIPESVVAAAALYRELTEDLALLVVLDNARSADQVRPLLPFGTRTATLVTSRWRLSGLMVYELAKPVPLDVLGPADAVALLAAAVGGGRVAAEPEAAVELCALCDGLPLAMRITAARLVTRPGWRLSDLAAELADEQRRLSLLSLDDGEESGVSAALRLTLQGLPPGAARLFVRLGALPGPDLDRYAAAALCDCGPAAAGEALDQLTGAHLVTEYVPGRYSLHDLVRLYARGLAADEGALLRLLDHYIVTALAAATAAAPEDRPCCSLPGGAYVPSEPRRFTGRDDALRWYAAERENLSALVPVARAAGHDDRAWRLVVLQWPYLTWHVRDGWVPQLEQALSAASELGDPDAEARVRTLLGWVLLEEDRLPEALAHLELAPALAARAGDTSSEATALVNLAMALAYGGATEASLASVTRAAALACDAGDSLTELLALEVRAHQLLARGKAAEAERCTAYGLTVLVGGTGLVALRHVLLWLARGEALLVLGEPESAMACAREARDEAERQGFKEGVKRARAQLAGLTETRLRPVS